MTVSKSPLAYDDAYAALDAALADQQGVRVKMADEAAAINFRMRCHQARKIDRDRNAETYEKPDPRHGASDYDRLILRIRYVDDDWYLYFEKNTVIPGEVESLSGKEVIAALPAKLVPRALPPPTPQVMDLEDAFEQMPTVEEKPKMRRI